MPDRKLKSAARELKARFLNSEDGAVTVDWIVLTAAVVGLAAVGGGTINDAVTSLGTDIADETSSKTVDNGN
ncbi:MAG: hypothetical protein AAF280_09130 [Pseudomonadota bacterium]